MDIDNNIEKIITVKYNSLDTLLERESDMIRTMQNYLDRTGDYELVETSISFLDNGRYAIRFKIRLIEE